MNKYTGFKRATNEFYPIFDGDDIGWQEADTIFIGINGKNHTGATPSEEDVALFKEWYSTNPPITDRRYTIHHVDTCCTDYWGGHHLPNFSVMVTGGSTYKDVRDGKVAVLIAPSFGGGWSTWSSQYPELLFDATVVLAVERKLPFTSVEEYIRDKYPDAFISSFTYDDLVIEWLEEGTEFIVEEYDGAETIKLKYETEWVIA